MSQSIRIVFDSMENLSDEAITRLFKLRNKTGWLSYNVHQIEAEDIIDLPPINKTEPEDRPPSKRLRAVFFRMWEQDNSGFKTADDHYRFMMEKLINFYKEKLN